jgi:hypothetical protein
MTITAVAARRDGPAGGRPGGVTVPAAALARGRFPGAGRQPGVTTQPGLMNTMPCGRKEGPASATRVSTPVQGFSVPR